MVKSTYLENDNELLYLIKNHDEEALELMFKKYENLILSKIQKYHFPKSHKEDYLQEGRIVLLRAIETYKEEFDKTFTRYFELLLQNRFNTLYQKNKKYQNHIVLVEVEKIDVDNKKEEVLPKLQDVKLDTLSFLEKEVFKYHFLENHNIDETSNHLNISNKQVYNTIQRIKNKLQLVVKNKNI
ncbi:MAG: sigma-70 family RNA polymerase sigma factor [Bacilli bacterium]|nr:sigma-70 family RNA polymerase sigma factor [Bacilli bacterium]